MNTDGSGLVTLVATADGTTTASIPLSGGARFLRLAVTLNL
jgi:hypothetical protein